MPIRLKILLGLLLLTLLSVTSLLTINDLRRQAEHFRIDVDTVLSAAVSIEFEARIDSIANLFIRDLNDTSLVDISLGTVDTGTLVFHFRNPGDANLFTSISIKELAGQPPVWTDYLRQAFAKKMKENVKRNLRENTVYYWTDHLGTRLLAYMDSISVDTFLLQQALVQEKKTYRIRAAHHLTMLPKTVTAPPIPDHSIRSRVPMPYHIDDAEYWVYLTILNPGTDLLQRSTKTILGSLGIILLSMFTFFFLYRLLLRERKLAALKDDFIDNVSHELQTPITALRMVHESLARLDPVLQPERRQQYLRIAHNELDRLSNLIDRLLLRNWEDEVQKEIVNLSQLITSIVNSHQLSNEKAVVLHLPEDPPPPLMTDPDLLYIILDNLIQNAVKYSNPEKVNIWIDWSQQAGELVLSIADDGWGIRREDRQKIFHKFTRSSDQERNYTVKGLGIGLYHVRQNLDALRGRCTVTDNSPKGTVFTLYFPTHDPYSASRR